MNIVLILISRLRLVVVLVVLGFTLLSSAQTVNPTQHIGTVQVVRQDDGFVTISGRSYTFDYDVTHVFLANKEISSAYLDEGMVVRYTLNTVGTLVRVEIIGPSDKIRILDGSLY